MSVTKEDLRKEQEAHAATREKLAAISESFAAIKAERKKALGADAALKETNLDLASARKKADFLAAQLELETQNHVASKLALKTARTKATKLRKALDLANQRLAQYGAAQVDVPK